MNREKAIVRTSLVGILANALLVTFKMIVGLLASSISIISDAINNFTDMISSIVTIIGTKLSNKKPDKEHPYGHGRIEYITSFIISVIIVVVGGVAIYEAIIGLINQKYEANYSTFSLIVIAVGVAIKIFLSFFYKSRGKKYNSQALKASGVDALGDALLSFSTLVVAIICVIWKDASSYHLENYLSIIIGLFIIKTGIDILRDSISSIIGSRADQSLINSIKIMVNSFPEVQGAYDLILNDYGPSRTIGSIHIQVDDLMTAKDLHKLTRKIQEKAYLEYGIILTVGIYANNDSDELFRQIKDDLLTIVRSYKDILQMHGFYVDTERKLVSFDLIIEHQCEEHQKVIEGVTSQIKEKYPDFDFQVVEDLDISD